MPSLWTIPSNKNQEQMMQVDGGNVKSKIVLVIPQDIFK